MILEQGTYTFPENRDQGVIKTFIIIAVIVIVVVAGVEIGAYILMSVQGV